MVHAWTVITGLGSEPLRISQRQKVLVFLGFQTRNQMDDAMDNSIDPEIT